MAEDNVERVRRAYENFNAHEFDAAVELFHPDVEWHQITEFPDRAVYRGVDDIRARFWNEQLVEQFGDVRIELEELIDAGDHVVAIGYVVGTGAASGLEFRLRLVNVLELRDGRVIRAYDVAGPSKKGGLTASDRSP